MKFFDFYQGSKEQRLVFFADYSKMEIKKLEKILDNKNSGYERRDFSNNFGEFFDSIPRPEQSGEKNMEFTFEEGQTLSGCLAREIFGSTEKIDARAFETIGLDARNVILNIILILERNDLKTWKIKSGDKISLSVAKNPPKFDFGLYDNQGTLCASINLLHSDTRIEAIKDSTRVYLDEEKMFVENSQLLDKAVSEGGLYLALNIINEFRQNKIKTLPDRRRFLIETANLLDETNKILAQEREQQINSTADNYVGTVKQNTALLKAIGVLKNQILGDVKDLRPENQVANLENKQIFERHKSLIRPILEEKDAINISLAILAKAEELKMLSSAEQSVVIQELYRHAIEKARNDAKIIQAIKRTAGIFPSEIKSKIDLL